MLPADLPLRLAEVTDVAALGSLIAASVRALGAADYDAHTLEAALLGAFGVDSELIRDRTYYVAEAEGELAACGGWSRRETAFGGDAYEARDSRLLDPRSEAARIRAFFVHPRWARSGLGSRLLAACERDALAAGFRSAELTATLPGERLYARHGYRSLGARPYTLPGGALITFVPMVKALV